MDDPAPAGNLIVEIIILAALIFMNAFFAMAEMGIISLNDNRVRKMADDGHKKARQVVKLIDNPSNFLSTIQIGITLAGFLTSASAAQTLATRLTAVLTPLLPDISPGLISGASVVVITLIMSYFSLVLGELVPKRIAMQRAEKVSFFTVGTLNFVAKISKPFIKLLSFSTNLVVKLLGFDPNANEGEVTEEEIRMMVDVGEEKGVIEGIQKEMINNIFEFDDISAGEIMTHRTDIVGVEVNDPLQDVLQDAIENGYSRIPVYEEDLDDIIGVIYIKDFLPYVGNAIPQKVSIRQLMRKAYYIPETKKCGQLFAEMTEKHVQMAVVVDEYGGTAGIVTMEDLLEFIVGNIQDEYDNEEEEISQIDETTFTIDGTTDLEEVSDIIGVELPEGEYETLGGFLISILGYLPGENEETEVTYDNVHFLILNVEERRIGKVRVMLEPKESAEAEANTK